MMHEVRKLSSQDIMLWPDGTWCFREELGDMVHMSDDYEIFYVGTMIYNDFYEKEFGVD